MRKFFCQSNLLERAGRRVIAGEKREKKTHSTAACRASKTPAGASCVHRHRLVAGCPITRCARRRTSALLRFRLLLRKKGRSQHSSFRQWIAPSLRQVRYVPPPACTLSNIIAGVEDARWLDPGTQAARAAGYFHPVAAERGEARLGSELCVVVRRCGAAISGQDASHQEPAARRVATTVRRSTPRLAASGSVQRHLSLRSRRL